MTKVEYATMLVSSPVWDGNKSIAFLVKTYTKQELKDAYDMMEEAEENYYNELYE